MPIHAVDLCYFVFKWRITRKDRNLETFNFTYNVSKTMYQHCLRWMSVKTDEAVEMCR